MCTNSTETASRRSTVPRRLLQRAIKDQRVYERKGQLTIAGADGISKKTLIVEGLRRRLITCGVHSKYKLAQRRPIKVH